MAMMDVFFCGDLGLLEGIGVGVDWGGCCIPSNR